MRFLQTMALVLGLAASVFANKYEGTVLNTTAGTAYHNLSGQFCLATNVSTYQNCTVLIDGITGTVTAQHFSGSINSPTASAFDHTPASCNLPQVSRGINADGSSICAQPSNITGNAATANALANTPIACQPGFYASGVDTQGNAICNSLSVTGLTWTKYTHPFVDFAAASTSNSISLFSLSAGNIIHAVKIKHSTAFSGTGITGYTVSVGISGSNASLASPYDVFQAVDSKAEQLSQTLYEGDEAASTTITATATSIGANLNASGGAGSVDIWVLTSAPSAATAGGGGGGTPDPLDIAFLPFIDTNPNNYYANAWITDQMQKVRSDSGSPGTIHWSTMSAVRNEVTGFQVHVQAPASGGWSNLRITMSDLTNAQNGQKISANTSDIIVHREMYANVTQKTSVAPTYYNSTGVYPDALVPAKDPYWNQTTNAFPYSIPSSSGAVNQSAWIDIHVGTGVASGYYAGSVYVSSPTGVSGSIISTMSVVLAVWDWQMPSTATLHSNITVGYGALCKQQYNPGGSPPTGCAAYPSAAFDDDGASLVAVDAAIFCLDHRVSCITPYPPLSAPPWGAFESRWEPVIKGTQTRLPSILPNPKLTSVQHQGTLTAASFGAWTNEALNRGWNYQSATPLNYTCDEGACTNASFITKAQVAHSTFPAMTTLWTTDMTSTLGSNTTNYLDIMVPIINNLDVQGGTLHRSDYNVWLASTSYSCGSGSQICPTHQLWSYQSCSSSGSCANGFTGPSNFTWPNYNIDGKPVANRAMEWMTYLHTQSGELYYRGDYCLTNSDCAGSGLSGMWPDKIYYSGGWGDGTLYYPGTTAVIGVTTPIYVPSIRLKQMRNGMQDYEYLIALHNAGQDTLVNSAINSWITNTYTFNTDPDNKGSYAGSLHSARQTLGKALHQIKWGAGTGGPW